MTNAQYSDDELEVVNIGKHRAVRVQGWLFANQDDVFWRSAFIVGFTSSSPVGYLVNADNLDDAFDEAADFVIAQDMRGLWVDESQEAGAEEEDEYARLGNEGKAFPGHELWYAEIALHEVPPAFAPKESHG